MNILSIQSHVAYGHVGNAAAAFALQRLGFEVWQVPTVAFSNHPAHGGYGGGVNDPDLITGLVEGLGERGFLESCDGVLSGYLGSVANGVSALLAIESVRAANPEAVYLCDPVFGHPGRGVFVVDGLPEFFRDKAVPAADIVTPNQFELEWLSGMQIETLEDAVAACEKLRAKGPETVICTSLRRQGAPEGHLETLLIDGAGAWIVATPEIEGEMFGAGDLFAALLLAHVLGGHPAETASSKAVSSVHAILTATSEKISRGGDGELALIEAQDKLVAPPTAFSAIEI